MYALFSRGMEPQVRALGAIGLDGAARSLRSITVPIGVHLPRVLRFHFADAAWGWALGASLALVWANERGARRKGWFVAGALLAVAAEWAQLVGVLPGTFDPIDLFVLILSYVTAWRLVSRSLSPQEGTTPDLLT
jgi:hypothetical protein